jgi:hypothetical protein
LEEEEELSQWKSKELKLFYDVERRSFGKSFGEK